MSVITPPPLVSWNWTIYSYATEYFVAFKSLKTSKDDVQRILRKAAHFCAGLRHAHDSVKNEQVIVAASICCDILQN